MTTLHDRLADLADQAPPGTPEPDLWDRGRRLSRRRRAGTAVIVAAVVVALAAITTSAWHRLPQQPEPANPAGATMRLPDRFYDAPAGTPSTRAAGPLGPLAAVTGSEVGLVGVSAKTGRYRVLDLPGWIGDDEPLGSSHVALSADGRLLAYWYVDGGTVRGVAVYDAATDEVARHDIDSDHGVMPDGLLWVGDRLWYSAPHYDANGTSTSTIATYTWQPGTDAVREIPLEESPDLTAATAIGDRAVQGGHRLRLFSPESGPVERLRVEPSIFERVVASPDGSRFAAGLSQGRTSSTDNPHPLVILTPDGHGGTTAQRVPHLLTNEILGWRDAGHVVVWTYGKRAYESVDVNTGEAQALTTPNSNLVPGLHVAADAWSAPTYPASPPVAHDPLVWAAPAAAVVVVGAALVVLWRRRVRP